MGKRTEEKRCPINVFDVRDFAVQELGFHHTIGGEDSFGEYVILLRNVGKFSMWFGIPVRWDETTEKLVNIFVKQLAREEGISEKSLRTRIENFAKARNE